MMKKMKKDEFLDMLAKKGGVSKKEAGMMLAAFTETVTDCLKKGNAVPLPGLGTFQVGKRAKREGRNPQTGAKMVIPAKKVPQFKAGKALKEAVM